MKRLTGLAGFAAAALIAGAAHAEEPWQFATMMSLTGNAAGYSEELKLGFEMAQEKINASGGIAGRPVQLKLMDTQSNPAQVATLIRQACAESLVVLGPALSNEARVAFPVANGMGCPALAAAAGAEGLTADNRPWTFAMLTPSNILTPAAVQEMVKVVNPARAVVLVEKSDPAANSYGVQAAKALADAGAAVDEISVSSNDVDFGPAVTRTASGNPDLIVISVLDRAAAGLLKELHKSQIGTTRMLTQSAYNATVGALPPEVLNNVYRFTQSDPGASTDPATQEFVAAFRERAGRMPSIVSTLTYDLLMLTKDTVEKAGIAGDPAKRAEERQAFIDTLAQTRDWQGLGGIFAMSEQGFMTKVPMLLVYDNGTWKPVNE
ncbi:ABC transporter substrate-binding protein [Ruixingdingia sedimenti]|uniref:ABC transporter substrate-binding protein n=1 Tax=Ruixingdingia sedimenti TaxID=3073604 RepID=A0ABU1F9Z6_9RHOB|nr:ABC transporter substrate-binding protein [Xinfangfangia sp. LG-4]MDR5653259.1 ABC transporter substrate-binding protein [Xinfangfangia sp. LG-4]